MGVESRQSKKEIKMYGKIKFVGNPGKLWTGEIKQDFTGAFEIVEKHCSACEKTTRQLKKVAGILIDSCKNENIETYYVLTGGVGSLCLVPELEKYRLWNWSSRVGGYLVPKEDISFLSFGYADRERKETSVPKTAVNWYAGSTLRGYISVEVEKETYNYKKIAAQAAKVLGVCEQGVIDYVERHTHYQERHALRVEQIETLVATYLNENEKSESSAEITKKIIDIDSRDRIVLPVRENEKCMCPPCRQKRAEKLYQRLKSGTKSDATPEEKMDAVELALASGNGFNIVYENWEAIPKDMRLECWESVAKILIPSLCGTWDNPSRAWLEDYAREGQVLHPIFDRVKTMLLQELNKL